VAARDSMAAGTHPIRMIAKTMVGFSFTTIPPWSGVHPDMCSSKELGERKLSSADGAGTVLSLSSSPHRRSQRPSASEVRWTDLLAALIRRILRPSLDFASVKHACLS
jgi:hypothetical protein